MQRLTIGLVVGFAIACGNTEESRQKPGPVVTPAPAADPAPAPTVPAVEPAPAPVPEPAPEPEPEADEPVTAKEIDQARKQAMIDGREKDVIKYCEMAGVDSKKTDPQVLLGCALAACRIGEVEKAKAWSKPLKGPLKTQAVTICKASNVAL